MLGCPFVPTVYILVATVILIVLFVYRPSATWPGLLIVSLGIPIYLLVRGSATCPARGVPSLEPAERRMNVRLRPIWRTDVDEYKCAR